MSSTVIVKENGQGRYQQAVQAGKHHYLADEPVAMGGADAGPAPFDFVLSGLGACTSMTLRMYAERKEWPLRQVIVELTHQKIDVDGSKRDCIQRQITLEGDLSSEQRERLLEIANKCPVHRALAQSFLLECHLTG
ncbi:OsmC family protein [Azonexus sp.]|uniref:OsmC family protein n=1 Tax=Azonexus sp. TaxID=1872668 RepID=UPI0039E3C694